MLPVPIPISIMMPMMVIVMVLMPIVVRILPSRFPAGSAVTNGSPRGSLSTFASARDATAGSGRAMIEADESIVVVVYR